MGRVWNCLSLIVLNFSFNLFIYFQGFSRITSRSAFLISRVHHFVSSVVHHFVSSTVHHFVSFVIFVVLLRISLNILLIFNPLPIIPITSSSYHDRFPFCIQIFLFFYFHLQKEKLAQRSRPDNHLKLADVEQQQPLRNGTLTKLYPDGTLPVNGSLHPNGSISLNGTVSHNGTLSHNGALSYHGTCPCSGSLSHNGSLNSLRHGVHRTTNGATVTVVHHDPLLGTRLEYIRKGTSDT